MNVNKIRFSFNSIFWFGIFLLLALPLHASNNLLTYVTLFNNFNIFHLLFSILALVVTIDLLVKKEKLSKKFIIPIILFVILVIGFIIGFKSNYDFADVLADFLYYFIFFLVIFVYQSNRIKKKNINDILIFASKAMNVSCFISIIMYFTRDFEFWGLISFNGGRYFGGNLSLLIITIPFLFYCYINNNGVSLKRLVLSSFIGLFCMSLSQSRASFFMIFIACILIMIFSFIFSKNKTITVRALTSVIFFVIFVLLFMSLDIPVVRRLLGADTDESYGTLLYRNYLYEGYFDEIRKSIFGHGFGAPMYFYNDRLELAVWTETLAVDSSIVTVGFKGGIVFLLIYCYVIFYIIFIQLYQLLKKKELCYLSNLIIMSLFLFSTIIITAQTIHTYNINCFFGILFSTSVYEMSILKSSNKNFNSIVSQRSCV